MSALTIEAIPQRRKRNYIYVGIRDGCIVRLKVCHGCGQEKIVSEDPQISGYWVNSYDKNRKVISWRPLCKLCGAEEIRAARARLSPEDRLRMHRVKNESIKNDPRKLDKRRKRHAVTVRAARKDPVRGEKIRADARARGRAARKDPVQGEKMRADDRMRARLRAEAAGRTVKTPRWVDSAMPRYPYGPFYKWLVAYARERKYSEYQEIANDLDICVKRVRTVLGHKCKEVTVDVVDKALINAYTFVEVDGELITNLEDLYPLES